jgi:hypothetical protein
VAVCGTRALKQREGSGDSSAARHNQYDIIATVAYNREGFSPSPVTGNMSIVLAGVWNMEEVS